MMEVTKGDITPIIDYVTTTMPENMREELFGYKNVSDILQMYSIEDLVENVINYWRAGRII